jgi:23S rRNA (cytosine1962-C5)-methyltransferase
LGTPKGIIEKSAPVRELEGLPVSEGLIRALASGSSADSARNEAPESLIIRENELLFYADLAGGQKTGYFLDQKENRKKAAEYAALLAENFSAKQGLVLKAKPEVPSEGGAEPSEGGANSEGGELFRILDCFCYTGGFAVHTAKAALRALSRNGAPAAALQVKAVDASAAALDLLRKNAALNDIGEFIETIPADAFDFLRAEERRKERYNLIILDPPAFAKSHSALEGALRGYKEINLRALKLLCKGGILVSCSCSHALDEGRFKHMIADAAKDAEKRIIQMDFKYQSPDHPILIGYDESLYLKCGFYRVV